MADPKQHPATSPDHVAPKAPAPGADKQPTTKQPEGLDDLADEGKATTRPAPERTRRDARE